MGNHLDFANLGALSWISILFTGELRALAVTLRLAARAAL